MRDLIRYECEMCGELKLVTLEDTICRACDLEMIAAERAALARFEAIRVKRPCRDCGQQLPHSRYFLCGACQPDLETEDRFDECDNTDMDELNRRESLIKQANRKHTEFKCNTCARTKPVSDFYASPKSPYGHAYSCKSCEKVKRDEYRSKKKAEAHMERLVG